MCLDIIVGQPSGKRPGALEQTASFTGIGIDLLVKDVNHVDTVQIP